MYYLILVLIALLIQIYSINLLKNNNDKYSRYSFWYNILSVIIGLISLYINIISYMYPKV
jgi:hypothetical protein